MNKNIDKVELREDGSHDVIYDSGRKTHLRLGATPQDKSRYGLTKWLADGGVPDPYVPPSDLQEWEWAMGATDTSLPRWGEDILDGMDKSGVNQITLDRLQAKKDLRATKP
jgi:hypothetical protein